MRLNIIVGTVIASLFTLSTAAFAETASHSAATTATGNASTAVSTPSPASTGNNGQVPLHRPPIGSRAVPLTVQECHGLGGSISPAASLAACASGSDCVRADEYGVLHHSCITK
jgi:hypothetical protein